MPELNNRSKPFLPPSRIYMDVPCFSSVDILLLGYVHKLGFRVVLTLEVRGGLGCAKPSNRGYIALIRAT